jgi:putative oxidoreductase
MLRNLSTRDAAALLLRISLGVIFIVHGSAKVSHDMGASWEGEFPTWMNVALAWGELIGGVAMLLGLLTRVTAVGFGIVMGCALYMVGTIKGFMGTPDIVIRGFDYLRVGSEFPFALLFQCGALALMGGGALSLDRLLLPRLLGAKKDVQLASPPVGAPHLDVAQAPAETSPR